MKLKQEILKLRMKWRDEKIQPRSKRRKVVDGRNRVEENTQLESKIVKKQWTKEKLMNIVKNGKLNDRLNLTEKHVEMKDKRWFEMIKRDKLVHVRKVVIAERESQPSEKLRDRRL